MHYLKMEVTGISMRHDMSGACVTFYLLILFFLCECVSGNSLPRVSQKNDNRPQLLRNTPTTTI